jgi:hypothetical protein
VGFKRSAAVPNVRHLIVILIQIDKHGRVIKIAGITFA